MFFIKDDNFLSDLSKRYIRQCFLNVGFPYYYGDELIINSGEHIPFLAHVIKKRDDDLINSDCYQDCVNMVTEFTVKPKIEYTEILRMAVNFTYPNGFEKCPVHQDHPFPHKQLIIYLNNPKEIYSNFKRIVFVFSSASSNSKKSFRQHLRTAAAINCFGGVAL